METETVDLNRNRRLMSTETVETDAFGGRAGRPRRDHRVRLRPRNGCFTITNKGHAVQYTSLPDSFETEILFL